MKANDKDLKTKKAQPSYLCDQAVLLPGTKTTTKLRKPYTRKSVIIMASRLGNDSKRKTSGQLQMNSMRANG
eukprot:m.23918 g.23918  ORF g.23918 m.23918 type:complete len:72 (-) comp9591_c0_seq1:1077-1292(-)